MRNCVYDFLNCATFDALCYKVEIINGFELSLCWQNISGYSLSWETDKSNAVQQRFIQLNEILPKKLNAQGNVFI